ncbi:MAG TPA: EAL domain-containing protein [Acidimicrobiales bacterium]
MTSVAIIFVFVVGGGGGGVLFMMGRRHGHRAQLLPLPHLLLMVAMACGPILLIGVVAIPWVLPLASYMVGQWVGVQARALGVRQGRAQRKLMFRELRAGRIQFHFQPIVDQFEGAVVACEALARWQRPDGVQGPGPWLDVIEADPTLAELFNEQLCASAGVFANQWPHVRVSLNTMPERMAEPGWAQRTLDRMLEHGSDPQQYTYEVLEGTLLRTEPAVYENLSVLRAAGCHVALDDFGEGQANVMRFMSFASYVDTIKIDQKLIQNPDRRGANCLIRLAQDYRMTVVAEGVETSEQLAWLRSMGVADVQGWVFCKALPPYEAGHVIQQFERDRGQGAPERLPTGQRTPKGSPTRICRGPGPEQRLDAVGMLEVVCDGDESGRFS